MKIIYYLLFLCCLIELLSCSKDDPVFMTPTTSVPSRPLNLNVISTTGTLKYLTWQTPENNGGAVITKYLIYRGTTKGSETNIGSVVYNVTNYTDSSANFNNITYYYYVTAINAYGESGKSNVGVIGVELLEPVYGATSVSLNPTFDWTDVSTAQKYIISIYKHYFSSDSLLLVDSSLANSTFIIPLNILDFNNQYNWNVVAKNTTGMNIISETFTFFTKVIGLNERANSIAFTTNGDLFVGGYFSKAGGNNADHIAKWDGDSWSSLNNGLDNVVESINTIGNIVYVGGNFINLNHIAKWNGSNWTGLGSGLNESVLDIAVNGNDVYAGGSFTQSGNIILNHIAKWNNSNWSSFSNGISNGTVYSVATIGNDVYVGGDFSQVGGINIMNIAKWNGISWSALGNGLNSRVDAIAINGNDVYVGGGFTQSGSTNLNYIAKWDGSSFLPLGNGLNGGVLSIAIDGSDVYVGGDFTQAGGIDVNNIAKWNGSSWSSLGNGVNSYVFSISINNNIVYAAGDFTTANGHSVGYIAKWNGMDWIGF